MKMIKRYMEAPSEIITTGNVCVIPATKRSVVNPVQLKDQTNIRVAAYCRVSTGDESQQTSYTSQKAFYTRLINSRDGWEMAGIYADEGLSGTCREKRIQFNKMMDDALDGKIGYIVTKSISRFARNTVDTLNCVRQLRDHKPPVGIYFEKENIDTLDRTGELMLTVLSGMAQDESRSISDNIRWSFQKKFQEGIPQINLNRMLGFDKGENGEWLVNEEQAKTVRIIFESYANGISPSAIARLLNDNGRFTVNEKKWCCRTVLNTLQNEKYVGDLTMQKTITKNFLTHRSVANCGDLPMFYIKDHHRAIIDRDTWNRVQMLLEQRSGKAEEPEEDDEEEEKKHVHIHMDIFCVCCGAKFVHLNYLGIAKNYTDKRSVASEGLDERLYTEKYVYRYGVYRCGTRIGDKKDGDASCPTGNYCEISLQQSFMEAIYSIREDYLENAENSWLCTQFAKNCQTKSYSGVDFFIKPDVRARFDLFKKNITELPEPTTDFYDFDDTLYQSFIVKGIAKGDTVVYTTNFGVSIVTNSNTRTLSDFTGLNRLLPDGTQQPMNEPWQVNGKELGYIRKKRKRVKKQE